MSARPTHDLAIKTGEYLDQTGQPKGRWLTVGTVFRHDDGGTSIKLDAIPLGLPEWTGWISVFPRKPREEPQGAAGYPGGGGPQQARHQASQRAQAPRTQGYQPFDDDVPF